MKFSVSLRMVVSSCWADLVTGALLPVLGTDVGGADHFGSLLLGLLDHVLAQTLGVDERGVQGILLGAVLVDALCQHHEFLLQILVFGAESVQTVRHLSEIIIDIVTAIAPHGFFKCDGLVVWPNCRT